MKKYAILGLTAGFWLMLGAGSANAGTQHRDDAALGQNRQQSKQHAEFASQHCEATASKQQKCLSFVGCREDEKAQKTTCEWAWKLDIDIVDQRL